MTAKELLRKFLGLGTEDVEATKLLQERMNEFEVFWNYLHGANYTARVKDNPRALGSNGWAVFTFWLGPKIDKMVKLLEEIRDKCQKESS